MSKLASIYLSHMRRAHKRKFCHGHATEDAAVGTLHDSERELVWNEIQTMWFVYTW